MVKLGTNLSGKMEKQLSADDGFDNIPLITPLEVSQLQQSFADKVIVKTSTHYQQQQPKKRNKLFMPNIEKLNISLYKDVSDRAKITGLILIMLAFLTSLLLLLMYKAMWYNRLTCPEGFILQQRHCTPADLEMFSAAEQQNPSDIQGGTNSGLYAALSRLNQVKRTGPGLPSPWLPIIRALKEPDGAKEENHQQMKGGLVGDE